MSVEEKKCLFYNRWKNLEQGFLILSIGYKNKKRILVLWDPSISSTNDRHDCGAEKIKWDLILCVHLCFRALKQKEYIL